jgi:subfamily B ATP-binding cassette protein MsbA
MHLLCRFYAPSAGTITLDDQPIADFKLDDYRRQFGLVSQRVVLFSDTVRANVAFGQLDTVTDAALNQALQTAQAASFVEAMPGGLDAMLGDGGSGLSGGQKQRLAIARAVLKDAPVLILDEATSALDNESEAAIQASLEAVSAGRTTLVIAHRLSTVERADMIVVMDEGRIVGTGTHPELMAAGNNIHKVVAEEITAGANQRADDCRRGHSDARVLNRPLVTRRPQPMRRIGDKSHTDL